MTTRRHLLALLAIPLTLAGCAASQAATQPAADLPSEAGSPPERASMVCGEEIVGEVSQILQLDDAPDTASTWAHDVYTCMYHLPIGPLVLSVNVSDTDEKADSFFDARRAEAPQAQDVAGLGEHAFGTGNGDVTVVKDDMTLTVDATALPETFGANDQKRSAFAFEVAADVMGCWTEHD
jgi:hypothetical protein